jgi:arsenate reductase
LRTVGTTNLTMCRPSEAVLDILLLAQKGPFRKEDGEVVIDPDRRG